MDGRELARTCDRLQQVLGTGALDDLGKQTGWVKRRRKATGSRMGLCMIAALCTQRVETLAQLQRAFNLWSGEHISYKPFHKRLDHEGFAAFMHQVVCSMLGRFVRQVLSPLPDSPLRRFSQVVIQDGSSFVLKHALADVYPGRFTNVTPSAVELHATLDLFNDEIREVSLAPDTVGEREFLPAPETLRGQLLLADRGYMDIGYAGEVATAGGHFIVRFKKQFSPEVVGGRVLEGRRLRQLHGPLKELYPRLRGRSVDLTIAHPRAPRLRLRLLALWNPGTRDHLVLVTNLPRRHYSARRVHILYRLRWQIELVFKEWKSFANLHKFDTAKAHIAEGLIWASLAAAILKRFLAHCAERVHGTVEISTLRAASALRLALAPLLCALLEHAALRPAVRHLLAFLSHDAARAHPLRDQQTGRKRLGLVHAHA